MGVIEWIAVAAVLAVATVLRVYGLTAGGFHIDEGYSLIQSERDLVDIFLLNRFDANPPFYIATLHIWRGFWGDEEFALKSLGVLGGILGVLGVWLAGAGTLGRSRELHRRRWLHSMHFTFTTPKKFAAIAFSLRQLRSQTISSSVGAGEASRGYLCSGEWRRGTQSTLTISRGIS